MPTKQLTREVKDFEGDKDLETLPNDGDIEVGGGDSEPVEKYSSQVARRLHENATLLLEEYDELMGPLEHEPTAKLLESVLEWLVEHIDTVEAHHSKHHPDEEPLAGAANKDLGDEEEAVPADSGPAEGDEEESEVEAETEGEETPEEEAEEKLENEDMKSLRRKYIKAIRAAYKKKGFPEADKEDARTEVTKKGLKGKAKTTTPGYEENEKGPGSDYASGDMGGSGAVPGSEEDVKGPGEDYQEGDLTKDLTDDHRASIGEASNYLKDMSETPTEAWGEEHRFKAYHFHKSLGDMHSKLVSQKDMTTAEVEHIADEMKEDAADTEADKKDLPAPGYEEFQDKPGENIDSLAHHKAIKSASDFLGNVAHEKLISDQHREEALFHHKALEPLAEAPPGQKPPDTTDAASGEINEKDMEEEEEGKGIKNLVQENQKRLDAALKALGIVA